MNSKTKSSLMISNRFAVFLIVLLTTFVAMSCSKDDAKPDTRTLFVGSYEVEDTSESSGNVYNYDITIVNGGSGDLEISNFADMLNVPVKAEAEGNKIVIKSQSFTNGSSGNTIEVSGEGTVDDNVLSFTYVTTGYLDYTGTCTATRK